MKKQIYLTIFLMSTFYCMMGQGILPREYEYDNAGNRIVRKVIRLIPPEIPDVNPDINPEIQPVEKDSVEFYTDKVGDISLKIYPNPTSSIITFEIEGNLEHTNGRIAIYDLSGTLIGSQPITSSTVAVDMRPYSRGIYSATILINDKINTWKIVKQ